MSVVRDEHATVPIEGPDVPWGTGTAIAAVVISVVTALVVSTVLYLVGNDFLKQHQLLGEAITYQGLTLGVLLSVTLLIFGRYDASPELLGYRFPGWTELFLSAATIVPVYAGVLLLYGAFHVFAPGYHLAGNAKDVFGGAPSHMGVLDLVGLIAFVGIEVPLTEETLFRGIMYQGFRHTALQRFRRVWAVLIAALVSGLIFGLAHGEIHTLPILWFLGVVLAYVFERTSSVYGSAALHATVNTSAALVYFLHG